MRNYTLLLTPLAYAQQCTLADLESLQVTAGSREDLALAATECITTLPNPLTAARILGCLQQAAESSNNRCIECFYQSISPELIACSTNCEIDPETDGCDLCREQLMWSTIGNCLPNGVLALFPGQTGPQNRTDVSQLFDGVTGSVGGGRHHFHGSDEPWGPNTGFRCSLNDVKKIIPGGREDMESFVECVGNLTSLTDSWQPCFPSVEDVTLNANCTECVTSIFGQVHISCMEPCSTDDGSTADSCKYCLSSVASMGIGLCTGVADPPVEARCSATDARTFFENNGLSAVLNCRNGDVTLETCLGISSISAMSMGCLACVGNSPAWSTAAPEPCNCTMESPPMRSYNPRMVCDESCGDRRVTLDAMSTEHCFDPNGFRRPGDTTPEFGINETVAILMPACSIDDIVTLSDAAGDITSCLDSSTPDVCMARVVTAEPVCTECVVSTLPTTCDSSDCWDESLSTSVGTCLYSGFPIQALADRGSIDPTTESPKSATVARTALTIFIATSFLVYNLF